MKKVLSAVLAAVLLVSAVFVFSSCAAKPELDLEKAMENLLNAGYRVTYYGEKNELQSAERSESLYAYKLAGDGSNENEELTVLVYKDASVAKAALNMMKQERAAAIAEIKGEIKRTQAEIAYFEALLEAHEEDPAVNGSSSTLRDAIREMEDEIDELEEQLESEKNVICGRQGKVVWYGTKTAIRDSRG